MENGRILVGVDGNYNIERAKSVIAGYAWGTTPMRHKKRDRWLSEPPKVAEVPRWAYATYDCIEPSEGPALSAQDLLVVAGLNGRITSDSLASMLAVADEVGDCLAAMDSKEPRTFWDIDQEDIDNPKPESVSYWMTRAWALMTSMPGIDLAISHKALHHKRPALFPLIDNLTAPKLRQVVDRDQEAGDLWSQVHREIAAQESEFEELERWFDATRKTLEKPGPALTRLRLHDILLWCKAVGDDGLAADAGRELLSQ